MKKFILLVFLYSLLPFFSRAYAQCTGYTNAACTYQYAVEQQQVPGLPYVWFYSNQGQGGYVKLNNPGPLDRCDQSTLSDAGEVCGAFLGNNTCGGCIPADRTCYNSGGPYYYPGNPDGGWYNTYWNVAFIQDGPADYNFCGTDQLCTSGCGYTPPCTQGTKPGSCFYTSGPYGAPTNTCYTNNGWRNETCTHDQVQTCNLQNFGTSVRWTIDNCSNTYACSAGNCITNIYVYVYKDYNHNGIKDAEDTTPISGINISDNGGNNPQTDGNGNVTFTSKTSGTYTITMTVPAGYQATSPVSAAGPTTISKTVNLGNNDGQGDQTVTFLMQPLYRIQGRVYNDEDSGRCYNPGGTPCTDKTTNTNHGGGIDTTYNASSSTVTVVGTGVNQTLSQADGTYDTGYTLPGGDYTVSYTNIPTNYNMTYPLNGPPPSFTVTSGTPGKSYACDTNNANDATCDGTGNISELNFGMNNHISHTQGWCTDWRDEASTQDFIPNNATCGTISGQYAILGNVACLNGPGIYYSGTVTPDFGFGSANQDNWLVGGATSESFSPVNPGITRTSNSYLRTSLKNNGITPTDLSTVCTPSNCYLPDNLPSGVYSWDFDTTIVGNRNSGNNATTNGTYTFPTGKNYVFLIGDRDNGQNSDLTLKSKILVPNGSTATFVASGNINIDPSVGESDVTSTAGDVEGYYSADGNFTIESSYVSSNRCNDNGTTKDLRFNLIGSVVINAAGTGGRLVNQRDLCASDLSCPTYSIGNGSGSGGDVNLGLTYFLNAPAIIKHKNSFWQELAP